MFKEPFNKMDLSVTDAGERVISIIRNGFKLTWVKELKPFWCKNNGSVRDNFDFAWFSKILSHLFNRSLLIAVGWWAAATVRDQCCTMA